MRAALAAFCLVAAPRAQTVNDLVDAYVWANNATSSSYTPSGAYSYNRSGGAVTATRSGTGTYAVTFAGLSGESGHVQVSAYGSNAVCTSDGWSGTPLTAYVLCVDPATRNPVDSRYSLLFVRAPAAATPAAFAWANDPTAASYTPSGAYSYNAGGAVTATRSGPGSYSMAFAGVPPGTGNAGTVLVTAYGSTATCHETGWGVGSGPLNVGVACTGVGGTPVDSRYDVLFVNVQTAASTATGYVWAFDPGSATYDAGASAYAYNHGGGSITATRSAAGTYTMTFSGLGGGASAGGDAQVSMYGGTTGHCTVASWSSSGPDVSVDVSCYNGDGALADRQYTVLFVWPNRPVAAEVGPNDARFALALAGPNPARGRTAVAVTLAEPGPARVALTDALGRGVAVLADRRLPAGTTTLDVDAAGLPTGVYVARLVAGGQARTVRLTVVR